MFGADGDADEIFGDAGVDPLGFGKLFVGCGPGMDGEGFGVADTRRGERRVSGGRTEGRFGAEGDWGLGTNLARLEMSLKPSTISLPAAAPPLTPNDKTPP